MSIKSELRGGASCFKLTLHQFCQDDSGVLRDKKNALRPLLRAWETPQQSYISFGSPVSFYPWISFYFNYDLISEDIQADFQKWRFHYPEMSALLKANTQCETLWGMCCLCWWRKHFWFGAWMDSWDRWLKVVGYAGAPGMGLFILFYLFKYL